MSALATIRHDIDAVLHGAHDVSSGPSALFWARWARRACGFLLILAGVSLLMAKLGASSMYQANEPLTLLGFLGRAGICLLHLYYLQLVLNLLVFHVPIQTFRYQTLIIPFLLVIAYGTGVYEILGSSHGPFPKFGSEWKNAVKFVSIMAFISVYYYWCIRDFYEAQLHLGGTKRIRVVWAVFDLIVFVVLAVIAICSADISQEFFLGLSVKDLCIALCVGLYQVFARISWWVERDNYVIQYQRYLEHQNIEKTETGTAKFESIVTCSGVSPVAVAAQWLQANPNPLIVDFGCADSRRLAWFLEELKTAGAGPKFDVIRFDIRRGWKIQDLLTKKNSDLLNTKTRFLVDLDELVETMKERHCLIHTSHVLYDRCAVLNLKFLLERAKKPLSVVVRGYGESIFRQISLFQSLTNARSSNVSHLWDSIYLPYLVDTCKLLPNARDEWNGGNIHQQMEKGAIEFEALEQFFRVLYGTAWTEMAQVFLRESWASTRSRNIPNPDVIYCFTRND